MAEVTPFQTVGPFFGIALPFEPGDTLTGPHVMGSRIIIEGQVRDGEGQPLPDAFIETWQANAVGRYRHPEHQGKLLPDPDFTGFGRLPTDDKGWFTLVSIRPGRVRSPSGGFQAPHILVSVLARGLLTRLVTRIYFPDEATNASDPVLQLVSPERRPTLIAQPIAADCYRFDIVLQGPGETVFFDV